MERTARAMLDEDGSPPPDNFSPVARGIPRSDKGGSRARTLFIRDQSERIHHNTGQWLDAEVATLTEIVFDVHEIITEESVRAARRPSTRLGRSGYTG